MIRPIVSPMPLVNHIVPWGPSAIQYGSLTSGPVHVLTFPPREIRAIEPPGLPMAPEVYQMLPCGPAVMFCGLAAGCRMAAVPVVVIRPT